MTVSLDLEVDPVVEAARKQGATEIVLAGASMGGTLSIAAAARNHAVRVASLSGPGFYNGADALSAISALKIPVLLVAASGDGEFAQAARQLAAAGPKSQVTHLELGGSAHGVATLAGSSLGRSVDDTFTEFLLAG
jgi:dienelactone hydrolase